MLSKRNKSWFNKRRVKDRFSPDLAHVMGEVTSVVNLHCEYQRG